MMRRAAIAAIACVAVFAVSIPTRAQRSIDTERFRPTLDPLGFLSIQGTTPPAHKEWRIGLWTHYSFRPLRAPRPGKEWEPVIEHRLAMDAQFQIGLFGRLALGLDVPLVLYQKGDADELGDGLGSLSGAAAGDPRITARVRIFGDATKQHLERNDGPGVALLFATPIPIGTKDKFTSERQFTFDAHLLADFHLLGAGGGVMLGWRFRADERFIDNVKVYQELLYGIAFKFPLPPSPKWVAIAELVGSSGFHGYRTNTLEGELGMARHIGDVTATLALGIGFVRGIGEPATRLMFGLSWAPKSADVDGDGVPDDKDECPRLPEDLDGFEDGDGCMDPDNDNDFVPDADDRCPNVEAIEGRDEDEDGCTDPE